MLVVFTCNAYENLTYFEDVALRLLPLMGHSATIPGAIKGKDTAEALARLEKGVGKTAVVQQDDDSDEPDISMAHRALPLINMLKAAVKEHCDVLWSYK